MLTFLKLTLSENKSKTHLVALWPFPDQRPDGTTSQRMGRPRHVYYKFTTTCLLQCTIYYWDEGALSKALTTHAHHIQLGLRAADPSPQYYYSFFGLAAQFTQFAQTHRGLTQSKKALSSNLSSTFQTPRQMLSLVLPKQPPIKNWEGSVF